MGLGKLIDFIVDDSTQKQGRYTPGDHIIVKPTNAIYKKKPDYVLILAWIHAKNIIKNNQRIFISRRTIHNLFSRNQIC